MNINKKAANVAAAELGTLSPDLVETVGGEPVIVKEISYLKALQFGPRARPLIDAIAKIVAGDDVDDKAFFEAIEDNADIFFEMLSLCTGKGVEYFDSISEAEGEQLTAALYAANRDFFSRRISRAIRRKLSLTPEISTQSSSITDTEKPISTDTHDDK